MSSVILSSSVRQNLLSLSATADLLSTTQSRLSTGKKVNSALDNPTNFFTAAGLDSRASDINNLLDGIGNGVQILQAANTGITSLSKLVDSAKSIANQALQTTVGYSTKSNLSVDLGSGATAANLFGGSAPTAATLTGTTIVNGKASTTTSDLTALKTSSTADSISTSITDGDTLTVNGKTITFKTGAVPAASSLAAGSGLAGNVVNDGNGNSTVYSDTATIADLGVAIDLAIGNKTAANSNVGVATVSLATGATATTAATAKLVISTGTASDLSIKSSNANLLGALGIGTGTATTTLARTPSTASNLANGTALKIAAVGNGIATDIVFGQSAGQVKSLDDLNAKLSANNLQASLDTTGKLTISTNNDNASLTIGSTANSTNLFAGKVAAGPVVDVTAQATRASLVAQYNQVIDNITTTAQDSSFNGVNLLNGDTLKLTFNETGSSKLSIAGVSFGPTGLGLSKLTAGTDFIDNNSANKTLSTLTTAATTLRSQASAFGSNLSVVQLRQDFSKSLINVLQTGSSNLTLADTNEEAANSQALSTRQSIAVSALSLANTAQQGVLQLLR